MEWYDWFAYASFSLYFAKVFFPKGDQTAQLLQTAAVFAVGFFARPVGAWAFGLYADRRGRKAALTTSVALMCFGSLMVAVLPGYATIGAAAPVILTLARLLQGFSIGGEYGASATYLSEMAGRERRGFWSSFQFVTLIGGQLTALGVLIVLQHTLSAAQLGAWGWRDTLRHRRGARRRGLLHPDPPCRKAPPTRRRKAERRRSLDGAAAARGASLGGRHHLHAVGRRARSASTASRPTCRSS